MIDITEMLKFFGMGGSMPTTQHYNNTPHIKKGARLLARIKFIEETTNTPQHQNTSIDGLFIGDVYEGKSGEGFPTPIHMMVANVADGYVELFGVMEYKEKPYMNHRNIEDGVAIYIVATDKLHKVHRLLHEMPSLKIPIYEFKELVGL